MSRRDPHSYNDDTQPEVRRVTWRARVDFQQCVIEGEATLHFDGPVQGTLDLDTRDLDVLESSVRYRLHAPEPILGARLELTLPPDTTHVTVRYRTSPTATALQWLEPSQTFGKRHPFLFSQCQAIHARSVLPLQDTPRIRVRYEAEITVPSWSRCLLAAAFRSREEDGDSATERYDMPQPIPPYLFALAVGQLDSRDVGPRSRVWAEPSEVERAAWEFGTVDDMLTAAEKLFGPYDWDRFDILTMPQSFPYGGMENPRLTFLTPTLLAGDRSLVSVVAHELAHSWTGNLVSSASNEHFWLNEGFTVFAERRIIEALEGSEVVALHAALGRRALEEDMKDMAPALTRLRSPQQGIDPDDAYSLVPYEKGYLLLRALEDHVGRQAFDRFLRAYIDGFRFRSITTDDFLAVAERELPGALESVDAMRWIDGEGIPDNAPAAHSARLDALRALGATVPSDEQCGGWKPAEWQLYLEWMPRPAPADLLTILDQRFHLTDSRNPEILISWLVLALASGHDAVIPRVEQVLGEVGRMKYLKPLYMALLKRPETAAVAARCFQRHAAGYHPIARQVIGGVLQMQPVSG